MNSKEMYDEIAALLGAVAKAFDVSDQEAARQLEEGRIALEMLVDDDGNRFVRAVKDGRAVRIYDGRIFYEEEEEEEEEDCGGGCSCGK